MTTRRQATGHWHAASREERIGGNPILTAYQLHLEAKAEAKAHAKAEAASRLAVRKFSWEQGQ